MLGVVVDKENSKLFDDFKSIFMDYDPAHFIQNNLKIDGGKFTVVEDGWKFMADVYRYIAVQATSRNGKPVIIKKGRQVGATMMAAALDLFFTNSGLFTSPPIRIAHLFPSIPISQRFSQDKLESLIRDSKNNFVNLNKIKNSIDNLTVKQFNTGTLWIESTGVDGDRLRGMTIDGAFFDECQDMVGVAINNTTKALTAAKYGPVGKGLQVYFGTPKEKENSWFANTWEMSDQRYYYLGCPSCKKTYPFYITDSDEWKKIWPKEFDIICPLCNYKTDKVTAIQHGEWVATKNSETCDYVGFHINQLYIPGLPREHINSLMPENNPNQSDRAWFNEVVGEFYAGAGMPLTRNQIEIHAKDPDRAFSNSISEKDHRRTYLGVDWGDKVDGDEKRGQSYSCVVILSDAGDGTLSIEHAHTLKKRDFEYKRDTINEMYRRFNITRGIGDYNFANDITEYLFNNYGTKFLGAQGSGNIKNVVKYDDGDTSVKYNKDFMIEELFDKIRKGKIRFPWKSYEKINWLIEHCTSMGTGIRTINGQPIKTYIKGSDPNDGLMALMYAYMAWKFDATKGYTIKPGIRPEQPGILKPALAYAPKLKRI